MAEIKFTETDIERRKKLARHVAFLRANEGGHNISSELSVIDRVLRYTNGSLPANWYNEK